MMEVFIVNCCCGGIDLITTLHSTDYYWRLHIWQWHCWWFYILIPTFIDGEAHLIPNSVIQYCWCWSFIVDLLVIVVHSVIPLRYSDPWLPPSVVVDLHSHLYSDCSIDPTFVDSQCTLTIPHSDWYVTTTITTVFTSVTLRRYCYSHWHWPDWLPDLRCWWRWRPRLTCWWWLHSGDGLRYLFMTLTIPVLVGVVVIRFCRFGNVVRSPSHSVVVVPDWLLLMFGDIYCTRLLIWYRWRYCYSMGITLFVTGDRWPGPLAHTRTLVYPTTGCLYYPATLHRLLHVLLPAALPGTLHTVGLLPLHYTTRYTTPRLRTGLYYHTVCPAHARAPHHTACTPHRWYGYVPLPHVRFTTCHVSCHHVFTPLLRCHTTRLRYWITPDGVPPPLHPYTTLRIRGSLLRCSPAVGPCHHRIILTTLHSHYITFPTVRDYSHTPSVDYLSFHCCCCYCHYVFTTATVPCRTPGPFATTVTFTYWSRCYSLHTLRIHYVTLVEFVFTFVGDLRWRSITIPLRLLMPLLTIVVTFDWHSLLMLLICWPHGVVDSLLCIDYDLLTLLWNITRYYDCWSTLRWCCWPVVPLLMVITVLLIFEYRLFQLVVTIVAVFGDFIPTLHSVMIHSVVTYLPSICSRLMIWFITAHTIPFTVLLMMIVICCWWRCWWRRYHTTAHHTVVTHVYSYAHDLRSSLRDVPRICHTTPATLPSHSPPLGTTPRYHTLPGRAIATPAGYVPRSATHLPHSVVSRFLATPTHPTRCSRIRSVNPYTPLLLPTDFIHSIYRFYVDVWCCYVLLFVIADLFVATHWCHFTPLPFYHLVTCGLLRCPRLAVVFVVIVPSVTLRSAICCSFTDSHCCIVPGGWFTIFTIHSFVALLHWFTICWWICSLPTVLFLHSRFCWLLFIPTFVPYFTTSIVDLLYIRCCCWLLLHCSFPFDVIVPLLPFWWYCWFVRCCCCYSDICYCCYSFDFVIVPLMMTDVPSVVLLLFVVDSVVVTECGILTSVFTIAIVDTHSVDRWWYDSPVLIFTQVLVFGGCCRYSIYIYLIRWFTITVVYHTLLTIVFTYCYLFWRSLKRLPVITLRCWLRFTTLFPFPCCYSFTLRSDVPRSIVPRFTLLLLMRFCCGADLRCCYDLMVVLFCLVVDTWWSVFVTIPRCYYRLRLICLYLQGRWLFTFRIVVTFNLSLLFVILMLFIYLIPITLLLLIPFDPICLWNYDCYVVVVHSVIPDLLLCLLMPHTLHYWPHIHYVGVTVFQHLVTLLTIRYSNLLSGVQWYPTLRLVVVVTITVIVILLMMTVRAITFVQLLTIVDCYCYSTRLRLFDRWPLTLVFGTLFRFIDCWSYSVVPGCWWWLFYGDECSIVDYGSGDVILTIHWLLIVDPFDTTFYRPITSHHTLIYRDRYSQSLHSDLLLYTVFCCIRVGPDVTGDTFTTPAPHCGPRCCDTAVLRCCYWRWPFDDAYRLFYIWCIWWWWYYGVPPLLTFDVTGIRVLPHLHTLLMIVVTICWLPICCLHYVTILFCRWSVTTPFYPRYFPVTLLLLMLMTCWWWLLILFGIIVIVVGVVIDIVLLYWPTPVLLFISNLDPVKAAWPCCRPIVIDDWWLLVWLTVWQYLLLILPGDVDDDDWFIRYPYSVRPPVNYPYGRWWPHYCWWSVLPMLLVMWYCCSIPLTLLIPLCDPVFITGDDDDDPTTFPLLLLTLPGGMCWWHWRYCWRWRWWPHSCWPVTVLLRLPVVDPYLLSRAFPVTTGISVPVTPGGPPPHHLTVDIWQFDTTWARFPRFVT